LNRSGCMHKQFDEASRNSGLDNGLDLIVRSIGEIGNGPAGINEDLIIE
jgi:hypothetical protein